MDALKEFFEAYSQRIKSPLFGYVSISLLFANWKIAYFLLFSDVSVNDKFQYFDTHWHWGTSFLLPAFIGVAVALSQPWVLYFATVWAEIPTKKRKLREVRTANEIASLRNELRNEQNEEVGALIAASKQDAEVQKIENEALRAELQSRIEEIRKSAINEKVESNANLQIDPNEMIRLLEKKAEMVKDYSSAEAQGYLDQAIELTQEYSRRK